MKQNLIDRAIMYVSPQAGVRRLRSRMVADQIRRFDAAGHGRRFDDWKTGNTTANQETEMSLDRLRARSRDLVRNNVWARKALNVISDNVIGTGIRPTPLEDVAKLKKAWLAWAESKEIDFDGHTNYYGLQRLIVHTMLESGECIVRRRRTTKNKSRIPFQLQVFEPDIIDTSHNFLSVQTEGGYVVQGVEFNKEGRRVGYWLFDTYPNDTVVPMTSLTSKFVSVDEVMHVYIVERPGQVRGIPSGVAGFLRLKDFDDFEDAELMRQKIAACFAAFVTESIDSSPARTNVSKKTPLSERVEPAIIQRLSPGEEVSFANPPTKEGMDVYAASVLRGISAGYGATYESVTGDLTNVNFSSGRMGWIEAGRWYSHLQQNVCIPMLCDPVWDWFLQGAAIGGVYSKEEMPVKWTAPRRELLDPVKEIQGINAAVRAGFSTWREAVSEMGYNPDEVLEEITKHNVEVDKREIILDSDPRYTDAAGKAKKEEGTEPKPKKKPTVKK